ncbi:hypothetical protein VM98_35770, partial [Streptomyces rubellomurinus subsp. indigoferus]
MAENSPIPPTASPGPASPPTDLSPSLDSAPAPVYVAFGSTPRRRAPPAPAACARSGLAAAGAHGRRVVLARGWAGLD